MRHYIKNLFDLYFFLTLENRRLIFRTIAASIVVTILEMLSLVALGLMIKSVLNYKKDDSVLPQFLAIAIQKSGGLSPEIAITLFFAIVAVFATLTRLRLTRMQAKVSQDVGHTISQRMFDSYLLMDYDRLIRINSSEITENITNKSMQLVRYTIHPFLQSTAAVVMLVGFFLSFVSMGYGYYTVIMALSAFFYWIVVVYSKRRLIESARIISTEHAKILSNINGTFGGMRNTVLENLGGVKRDQFLGHDKVFRNAEAKSLYISTAPKHLIEGAIMLSLAAVVVYMLSSESVGANYNSSLTAIGLVIVIFQKSLPLMQSIFYASTNAQVGSKILQEVLAHLKMEFKEWSLEPSLLPRAKTESAFVNAIELINVSYKYPSSSQLILRNVNMRIELGDRIGIFGRTGSGKSTLLDILVALLTPSSGNVICDGFPINASNKVAWRSKIGYLPQSPFFEDGDVRSNLVLDITSQKRLNDNVLTDALIRAGLASDRLEAYRFLSERVGERGNLLSGGQRQKLALARILLTGRNLILLDEATAALDTSSEREVAELIASLPKNYTVIMVTHRIQPLFLCDRFFLVRNSTVSEVDGQAAKDYFTRT